MHDVTGGQQFLLAASRPIRIEYGTHLWDNVALPYNIYFYADHRADHCQCLYVRFPGFFSLFLLLSSLQTSRKSPTFSY